MKQLPLLACFLGFVLCAVSARGQAVFIWTGQSASYFFDHNANWEGVVHPPDDIEATHIVFGNQAQTHVVYDEIYVNQISFIGNTRSYWLEGDYDTTHIGNGGIYYSPASPVTSYISGNISLEANQTWNIQSGQLVIDDQIYDNEGGFMITKTGSGTLVLSQDAGTWTGGFKLSAGTVSVQGYYDGDVYPFGNGPLIFDGGTLLSRSYYDNYYYYYYDDVVSLNNAIESNGLISTVNVVPVGFQNTVTLNANTTITSHGALLFITGDIYESESFGGPFSLTVNGTGRVFLGGDNHYSGGTTSTNGVLVFTTLASLPANPLTNALTAGANGYIGMGDDGIYNFQTAFVDRFNKAATFGTIGFDTDPEAGGPTDFSSAINLTGFGATARLGSATWAVISGAITPQGSDYRFGGGGGFLQVDSQLTGARNLILDSPLGYALTLRLTASDNNFTGTMNVSNSALIFAEIALPPGSRTIAIGPGGYVGTEEGGSGSVMPDDADIATFLAHVTLTSSGMVGFDAPDYSYRDVSRPINLSPFTGQLYLGSSTPGDTDDGIYGGITISGPLTTTNGGADPYRFAGYKGGLVEITSTLTGSQGVIIGDPNSPSTFGDPVPWTYGNQSMGRLSTVVLSGNNSGLTGNIILYGGKLAIGQSNGVVGTDPTTALGSGTVVVQPMALPANWTSSGQYPGPALFTDEFDLIVSNPFTLNTTLHFAEYSDSLTLTGKISGTGGLYLNFYSDVVLSNDTNDFSGGIYVASGAALTLQTDHSAGTGMITFGSTAGSVYFGSANPVINGLASRGDEDYSYVYADFANMVLHLNQAIDTRFLGEFRSTDSSDAMRLVKDGAGTLNLDVGGFYFHHGTVEPLLPSSPEISLQINQGNVVLSDFYLEDSAPGIWVHGGTLTLNDNGSVGSLVVVDNGGRIQGNGTFYSDSINAGVILKPTAILSPGLTGAGQVGALFFDDLTLMGGAILEFTLKDPNGQPGESWDLVAINDYSVTLHVDPSVTPATPFTIKLISLNAAGNPGPAVGFMDHMYTWTIFDASESNIDFHGGSFNPAAFVLDTSAFSADVSGFTSMTGPGTFAFVQNGNLLQINFTPVPEPSTYALLGAGIAMLAWKMRRRSKRPDIAA